MGNINKGTPTLFHQTGKPYTAISNAVVDSINNPDALAIWTFLQTKSNGWNVIGSYLMDKFGIGRKRYADAMKHLTGMGLVEYKTTRNDQGQVTGKRIVVNYEPSTEVSGNRHVGKPTIRSNNNTVNKQLPIKDVLPINKSSPINENTPIPPKGGEEVASIPLSQILSAYHEALPNLPRVAVFTDKRKKQISARWKEDRSRQNLDWWIGYFHHVSGVPFLNGQNERGWRPDLEWLTNQNNMAKVIEGKYENE